MNNENLKHFTKENAAEYGKKGGIASGIARTKRKSIRNELENLLELEPIDAERKEQLQKIGYNNEEINNQSVLLYDIYKRAINGDIKATKLIVDIMKDIEEKDSLSRLLDF